MSDPHPFSAVPHLEAVSSISYPRTRHAVVTRDTINLEGMSVLTELIQFFVYVPTQ
jgi:hypothetical protein